MVPVQVLVGVPAWWSSETNGGEAEPGEAAARTGDHFFLVYGVAAARTEWGRAGGVVGRGAEAVVVVCEGAVGVGRAPSQRSTHDHVVVVQMRKRRQTRGPVGVGRPPAICERRSGGRRREFGIRRRSAVLRFRGAGAIHRLLVLLLLVERQGFKGQRKTRITGHRLLLHPLLLPQQPRLLAASICFTVSSICCRRGLILGEDIARHRCEVRRRRAGQRVAAPVPPRQLAAVSLGRRGVVAVRRGRQGEGQRDDGLAGSVEQLDLASFEVLPL